tara:strand:- start:980 stop:1135 length:156 start_codon:yes stop_codon:yes gene_type:complete
MSLTISAIPSLNFVAPLKSDKASSSCCFAIACSKMFSVEFAVALANSSCAF